MTYDDIQLEAAVDASLTRHGVIAMRCAELIDRLAESVDADEYADLVTMLSSEMYGAMYLATVLRMVATEVGPDVIHEAVARVLRVQTTERFRESERGLVRARVSA